MAIKEGNARVIVTIPAKLKEQLEAMSYIDKRTISKEIEYILERHVAINARKYGFTINEDDLIEE